MVQMLLPWLSGRVIQLFYGFYVPALLIEEAYSSFGIAITHRT